MFYVHIFFHFCIIAEDCHVTMVWNKLYKYTEANFTWVDSYSIELLLTSIEAVEHEESSKYHEDTYQTEEYMLVSWVDGQEQLLKRDEEDITKKTPPVQSKDAQIKATITSMNNKIKKHNDLMTPDVTISWTNWRM